MRLSPRGWDTNWRARSNNRPCLVTLSDLRLRVAPEGVYLYPDVMAVCKSSAPNPGGMILNPVEVLSPSTERWARFAQYQRVQSLREYVLVPQQW